MSNMAKVEIPGFADLAALVVTGPEVPVAACARACSTMPEPGIRPVVTGLQLIETRTAVDPKTSVPFMVNLTFTGTTPEGEDLTFQIELPLTEKKDAKTNSQYKLLWGFAQTYLEAADMPEAPRKAGVAAAKKPAIKGNLQKVIRALGTMKSTGLVITYLSFKKGWPSAAPLKKDEDLEVFAKKFVSATLEQAEQWRLEGNAPVTGGRRREVEQSDDDSWDASAAEPAATTEPVVPTEPAAAEPASDDDW